MNDREVSDYEGSERDWQLAQLYVSSAEARKGKQLSISRRELQEAIQYLKEERKIVCSTVVETFKSCSTCKLVHQ